MKKFNILILTIFITPVLAGFYGILHDQFTYSISPEYYTKFKFYQFGLVDIGNDAQLLNPRLAVCAVGFMATWWTGIFVALGQGLTGLIHKDHKTMLTVIVKAILITLVVAALTGLTGLAYGKLYLSHTEVSWWMPDNLTDKENYIAVGSMHNFSYIGGALGLATGIIYQVMQKKGIKA
ncbi:MAG: hypothetical protein AB7G44_11425 [Bacteroidia bacterium]